MNIDKQYFPLLWDESNVDSANHYDIKIKLIKN